MTLATPAPNIEDSGSLSDLPFGETPQVPVRAVVQVDLSDGVRYQQECGHRTWWAGGADSTPKVGQLRGCLSCWAELLNAEGVFGTGAVPVALPTHADPATPAELLADFNQMRRWLASKAATEEVGWANAARTCPIAHYLDDNRVDQPLVTPHMVQWCADHHVQCEPLPQWAARFVALVDQQPRQSIRASLAMTLLYEAVRDDR